MTRFSIGKVAMACGMPPTLTWLNDEGELLVNWAGNHAVFKNEPGGFEGESSTSRGRCRLRDCNLSMKAFDSKATVS